MRRYRLIVSECLSLLLVLMIAGNVFAAFLDFVERQKDGVGGVDGLFGAFSVAVSPDGRHVYVAGVSDNAVAVFSRNSVTGALTYVECQKDGVGGVDGLNGVRSVTVSPDGSHVYAAGQNDNAVAVFSRDSATGALSFVGFHQDGDPGVDGLFVVGAVTVSPDGSHVYVVSAGEDSVAVFSRDSVTGALSFVECHKDVDPGVDGLNGANYVTVSPDGRHVYVASFVENAVAVFSRNNVTGALTFVECHKDGVGVVDGLDKVRSVTVSPDDRHVYAAGQDDNAVAVFSRDSATGALSFVECQKDGVGGVDGLDGAHSVTVSPDGSYVYAAGYDDNAVAVFSRNSTTGALSFVECQKDNVGGVDGLDSACSVTVSPDDRHVYAAGQVDSAVAVFALPVYTLTVTAAGTGSGSVSSTPSGITCPVTCANTFLQQSSVTLTATPDAGSAFDGWSGEGLVGNNGDCSLTMDQDRAVTVTFNPDTDGDGISDIIENAGPNSGDADGNGTLDLSENNVVTFRTIYGDYITLVSEAGTNFAQVVFQGCPSPGDVPQRMCFDCGFFGFTLQGLTPGASTMVTAILHSNPTCSYYYRYGPTPDNAADHWYRFSYNGQTGAWVYYRGGRIGARLLYERQTLTYLYFVDGGRGDDDLAANGVIVDVGGPARRSGGGGGGGCFIRSITGE